MIMVFPSYHTHVCVYVRACVRARACVCVCVAGTLRLLYPMKLKALHKISQIMRFDMYKEGDQEMLKRNLQRIH